MAKILVADDDLEVRKAVAEMLTACGHEVVAVASGLEALAVLEGDKTFGLVLTDRLMPKMRGEELARQIKLSGTGLPVIMMTGDDLNSAERRLIEIAGISYVLSKPLLEGLEAAIAAAVNQPAAK